jgi:glutamyl-tRNA reductase
LAFRDDEIEPALAAIARELPVAEALLISTCNRVEVYGVARGSGDATSAVRSFLLAQRGARAEDFAQALYSHRGPEAVRHVLRVASSLDSLVVGEAQILGQLKAAYALATKLGTTGVVLSRCFERAFGVAKRVRTETAIARGAANVSSVAVELATLVFGKLAAKRVLVIGAGKMSTLAARHLYTAGAERIVVTNRAPDKAETLAAEIDGLARPFADLESLLVEADVVISSTGARQPILTHALLKRVNKARRGRSLVVIDIAVPRDAEGAIGELDGLYLYDIDDLDKVVRKNLAERMTAAAHADKIVEHEATQLEQWLRTQGVVPTIRALRDHFARIAEAEVHKAEQLANRELSVEQQRDLVRRVVQLVVNKLLHMPTTVLRGSEPGDGAVRAAILCELFALTPSEIESEPLSEAGAETQGNVEAPVIEGKARA